jgi:hypothetical protein
MGCGIAFPSKRFYRLLIAIKLIALHNIKTFFGEAQNA